MRRTPVYIVCSPRPAVGKTLIARALTEFLVLQRGKVIAFDINLREPSLLNYLPRITETAAISDTFGQMALMDRLIVNDNVPKVVEELFKRSSTGGKIPRGREDRLKALFQKVVSS